MQNQQLLERIVLNPKVMIGKPVINLVLQGSRLKPASPLIITDTNPTLPES